jgi:hypothetical protein
MNCGKGCSNGSPYAFMKYDCGCGGETCGGGFCTGGACSKCGQKSCTCGDKVACGDGCGGRSDWTGCSSCQGGCGGGCGACGKRSPCWLLDAFCKCSGCGELYFNEWCNDPPSCCDPCDCYGNWVGCGPCNGCYRAPYRSHNGCVAAQASSPPPLELADEAPVSEAIEQPAVEHSEKTIDHAAAAAYDDSDLDSRLQ